jgi:hypothetical protein
VRSEAGEGKVSEESIREAGVSALGILRRTGPLRSVETPCTENEAGALHAEAVRWILPAGGEMKMEISTRQAQTHATGVGAPA